MDPSKRGFMNLLNQGSPSQQSSQNSPPTQFPSTFSQSQFPQSPHFTQASPPNFQTFNPFGPPANYHLYGSSPPNFQGFLQQASWLQSAPISFQGFRPQESWMHSPNQVVGSASSHGSKSASQCPARQEENNLVNIEESSDNSQETGRRGTHVNWTEEENLRLLSSWLNNSLDSINGNDKKGEYYWRDVAAEFNGNASSNNRKRTVVQCKTHWGGVKKDIAKFCGAYSRARRTWSSGFSDDMIMEKAHALYKSENNDKTFTLEYMWRELKDQPKWRRILEEDSKNKRTKISESGAYTSSSNQETEEETSRKEKRPEGQKKAKAKLKGKGKKPAPSPLGDQPSQDFVLFNEAVKLRAEAVLKSAEATTKSAEAKKEQTRMEKYQTYLKLLDKDTANFSDAKLKRHEAVLEKLATELAEE
ncbi:glutathione S-transferase T2-like [Oryza sativa Japonica Group]|uniref:Os04g0286500 protein n=2 Tax=Oryza sativa subsp. japonica TaxID=39947 RepID=Q0JEE5_ORYSJ|nr:glutathione S-transferase T2 [Oryza sativa Japonica Group]XP_015636514.1 glutathione S-transferase T2 [Oryza sativa Japonica Group]XP_015636515.1 glutathione S-transferase T2 [Oryza sativa Japonica Group]XP_015636516.1 glutathione S-transferase T2 [Oryza sativa Japonica Group]XP_015636517.1 glutathione S-transferase T2 [Oryza sativa Japonica Group]XP_025880596.1 glutathione S-transferase T2 [Oryza sativa Japonica Group]XP_025880597.1 glutathione S-transferase T2 [Oryza sativa Japonica Grou|eukprot:NP_001052378.1 Os04g0286500 [Oryza sativa Japonica Group]